jgi:hypothetical protein
MHAGRDERVRQHSRVFFAIRRPRHRRKEQCIPQLLRTHRDCHCSRDHALALWTAALWETLPKPGVIEDHAQALHDAPDVVPRLRVHYLAEKRTGVTVSFLPGFVYLGKAY